MRKDKLPFLSRLLIVLGLVFGLPSLALSLVGLLFADKLNAGGQYAAWVFTHFGYVFVGIMIFQVLLSFAILVGGVLLAKGRDFGRVLVLMTIALLSAYLVVLLLSFGFSLPEIIWGPSVHLTIMLPFLVLLAVPSVAVIMGAFKLIALVSRKLREAIGGVTGGG